MTEAELLKEFEKEFKEYMKQDCWDYSCEARDCCECDTFKDWFESYKEENKRGEN